MAELFRDYEKEFGKYIRTAKQQMSLIVSSSNDQVLQDAKDNAKQAQDYLRKMENQLMSLDSSQASQFRPKLNRHKETYTQLMEDIKAQDAKSSKKQLIGNRLDDPREKLLTNNEIIQASGEGLERANKMGLETEQVGYDVVNNLKGQRKQIVGINDKVNDVGSNVRQANNIITSMDRRRIWMKIIMLGIIILLIVAICLVLVIKLA